MTGAAAIQALEDEINAGAVHLEVGSRVLELTDSQQNRICRSPLVALRSQPIDDRLSCQEGIDVLVHLQLKGGGSENQTMLGQIRRGLRDNLVQPTFGFRPESQFVEGDAGLHQSADDLARNEARNETLHELT